AGSTREPAGHLGAPPSGKIISQPKAEHLADFVIDIGNVIRYVFTWKPPFRPTRSQGSLVAIKPGNLQRALAAEIYKSDVSPDLHRYRHRQVERLAFLADQVPAHQLLHPSNMVVVAVVR